MRFLIGKKICKLQVKLVFWVFTDRENLTREKSSELERGVRIKKASTFGKIQFIWLFFVISWFGERRFRIRGKRPIVHEPGRRQGKIYHVYVSNNAVLIAKDLIGQENQVRPQSFLEIHIVNKRGVTLDMPYRLLVLKSLMKRPTTLF